MAALRIYAAAGHPDIAEQKLQHRRRVDELHRMAVLRPAERIEDRSRAARAAGGANDLRDTVEFLDRATTNLGDALRGVAGIMLLQELKHGAWVIE